MERFSKISAGKNVRHLGRQIGESVLRRDWYKTGELAFLCSQRKDIDTKNWVIDKIAVRRFNTLLDMAGFVFSLEATHISTVTKLYSFCIRCNIPYEHTFAISKKFAEALHGRVSKGKLTKVEARYICESYYTLGHRHPYYLQLTTSASSASFRKLLDFVRDMYELTPE